LIHFYKRRLNQKKESSVDGQTDHHYEIVRAIWRQITNKGVLL